MRRKIVVIGSGLGGLAAGIRLAARGHDVEMYEKRDQPGGRAYVYEINGFTFDGGPSIITAPFLFDDLWSAAGKNREDTFQMVPVEPFYRVFDHQRDYFDYNGDTQAVLRQIAIRSPNDQTGYQRYVDNTRLIYEKASWSCTTGLFSS